MAEEERELQDSLNDGDLLNEAMGDAELKAPEEIQEPEPHQEPEPQKSDPERDEKGRFKAKEQEAENQAIEQVEADSEQETELEPPQGKESHGIPSWRLKEVADAKRAAEEKARQMEAELNQYRQQMQQLQSQQQTQKQPDPIDPYEDPEGWQSQQQSALEQRLLNERFNTSELLATRHYGREAVQEALNWAQTLPPHEIQAIKASYDPYGEMIERKRQADTLAEIGTDPKAYRERVLQEAMKDPEFVKSVLSQAKTEAASRPESHVTKLPASLNRQQSAADAKSDAGDPQSVPMSDRELLADAMRR